jgi:hypothetical protein
MEGSPPLTVYSLRFSTGYGCNAHHVKWVVIVWLCQLWCLGGWRASYRAVCNLRIQRLAGLSYSLCSSLV